RLKQDLHAMTAEELRGHRETRDSLTRLREELSIVQREIVEQEHAVNHARAAASREICNAVKPEHDQVLRKMALSVIATNKLALELAAIRERLSRDDVSVSSLPAVVFSGLGIESMEPCSRLFYWTRECVSLGVLDRNDIPDAWAKAWGL